VAGLRRRLSRLEGGSKGRAEAVRDPYREWIGSCRETRAQRTTASNHTQMLAICNRKPGTDHMELPDEWREAFEAGAELRRRFAAMPPKWVAAWIVERNRRKEAGATEEELKELDDTYRQPYGITAELEELSIGPDRDELDEDEKQRRIGEYVHDVLSSPWGFEMAEHARKLDTGG
jgi:hypothetical protein